MPQYLYHATRMTTLLGILEDKVLIAKGERINGYDEDTISLSDILSDYIIFYGDVVMEFIATNLFRKNRIYPYVYGMEEDNPDFYDMPFWESEWRAKEVVFEYFDINKIYFFTAPLLSVKGLLRDKGIELEIVNVKDLQSYDEAHLIERYKERIKMRCMLEKLK